MEDCHVRAEVAPSNAPLSLTRCAVHLTSTFFFETDQIASNSMNMYTARYICATPLRVIIKDAKRCVRQTPRYSRLSC